MALYCTDADLLVFETQVFVDPAFLSYRRIDAATATLTGTALELAAPALEDAGVEAGMVAVLGGLDGVTTALAEIVAVADATHATLSVLRASTAAAAVPPVLTGNVRLAVVSFRPQIQATGERIRAALGLPEGSPSEPPVSEPQHAVGFRHAAIVGTLATLYRTLYTAAGSTPAVIFPSNSRTIIDPVFTKFQQYDALYRAALRSLGATVDRDGDGTPETPVRGTLATLHRV